MFFLVGMFIRRKWLLGYMSLRNNMQKWIIRNGSVHRAIIHLLFLMHFRAIAGLLISHHHLLSQLCCLLFCVNILLRLMRDPSLNIISLDIKFINLLLRKRGIVLREYLLRTINLRINQGIVRAFFKRKWLSWKLASNLLRSDILGELECFWLRRYLDLEDLELRN